MEALKDVYEIVFDLAIKANLPTEVAKLRGKLEQLEQSAVGSQTVDRDALQESDDAQNNDHEQRRDQRGALLRARIIALVRC